MRSHRPISIWNGARTFAGAQFIGVSTDASCRCGCGIVTGTAMVAKLVSRITDRETEARLWPICLILQRSGA